MARRKSPDLTGCPRCGAPLTRISGLMACSRCGPLSNASRPGLPQDADLNIAGNISGDGYKRVPDLNRDERGEVKPDLHLDSPYRKAW